MNTERVSVRRLNPKEEVVDMAKKAKTAKKAKNRAARAKKPRYSCEVCGMAVTVDNVCGCVDTCDIVCCGQQMKKK